MYYDTIKKIVGTQPVERVVLRHYGETARPSVPVPNLALTEALKRGQTAEVWVEMHEEKNKKQFIMLVKIDVE